MNDEAKPEDQTGGITTEWQVEIESPRGWITFASGFNTRGDAEWAVGQW